MGNTSPNEQAAMFEMLIPKEAFVSNFILTIDGENYIAKVEEKEQAELKYKNSQEAGAGLLSEDKSKTDKKRVFFQAKLQGNQQGTFFLKYEEQLQENPATPAKAIAYRYELDINLGDQLNVEDFSVDINIDESREI